jgi:CYTH domain-containing protein
MYHEIERKFLIAEMPSLRGIKKVSQERYFIQRGDLFEEGYKREGGIFEYESKVTLSQKEKTREKTVISKEEFERLKAEGTQIIERDSYLLFKKNPRISIKIYKGVFNGLVLAEVLFDSLEEFEKFEAYDWMGIEVTDTPLGKDARLADLDREGFKKILNDLKVDIEVFNDAGSFL